MIVVTKITNKAQGYTMVDLFSSFEKANEFTDAFIANLDENQKQAFNSLYSILTTEVKELDKPDYPFLKKAKPMTDEEMELAIANKIVDDALALNYTVSVYDSEEWALKRSSDKAEIIEALNSTGWDQLKFRTAEGFYVGVAALIWGNSYDLISDYTASPEMEALLKGANELADQLSEAA